MGSLPVCQDALDNGRGTLEPMAIIGMATRLPQEATSNENLWKFLLKARSAHTPFPKDRINSDGHYHPDPEHGGTFAVKGGHFLSEDPAYFDAPFFSTTRSEVLTLDPQQRVLMENVYHALENGRFALAPPLHDDYVLMIAAGIPLSKANSSNTSVYVSGFNHDYLTTLNTDPETTLKYKPTGTTNSLLSNRVSWFFDFKGPSLTLDTACSSSMVALHLACQSLRYGESDMSVVSGVTMILGPIDTTSMGHHGFLSPEGKCFSFDHRADGYARGEGVGTIIVKRLADALRDGDTIRAVVRGTGVNQDGKTAGITLPSSAAQERLMREVYASAGLNVVDTVMIESHGTGTAAGDPIEASAIARTFASRSIDIPLFVGAMKSGIGHLEGAAGIAGIIKGILILENGIIPPNVNFEKVNPRIPIDKWNLQFPLQNTPWPKSGLRRISVNSFGVGGTNAHTVLDDAYNYLTSRKLHGCHSTVQQVPSHEKIQRLVAQLESSAEVLGENGVSVEKGPNNRFIEKPILENGTHIDSLYENGDNVSTVPRLFVFSSFDEEGVKRNAAAYGTYLKTTQRPKDVTEMQFLNDLAYTLSDRRSVFPWRSYTLASSVPALVESLSREGGIPKAVRVRTPPKIGFIFTGQGAQWYAMGRDLLVYPVFKESLEEATTYIKSLGAKWSLLDELLMSKAETRVHQPFLAHPACTALQIAVVDLLASWGILPERVIGHSSGEIAAAYCSGKLSRKASWKVAYYRGFVSAKQLDAKGAMIAVGLSEADLQPYIKRVNDKIPGEMVIACFNSPKNCTVSGDEHKINVLKEDLDAVNGIFSRKLDVLNAYHSGHMRVVADEYLECISDISSGAGSPSAEVYMFSTVTGVKVKQDYLDGEYWVTNLVSPVRFTDALLAMCFSRLSKGQASLRMNANTQNIYSDTLIEIGPHTALHSAVKEILAAKDNGSSISYLPSLKRNDPGTTTILGTAGFLSSRGSPVNVSALNASSRVAKGTPQLLVRLPPYSFNHSEKVWYESRLSLNYRLRKYPRHDLFGAPVSDWNSETPRWRHIIRLSEQPWLRAHIVTNAFVYPGVGYLIAVLEASRQIADSKLKIAGFRFRDVYLKRALMIPDNKEGVETSLSLTRMDESSLWGSSVWKRFQMSSYDPVGDDWIEHCTGYVAVDYETDSNLIDGGREAEAEKLSWGEILKVAHQRCIRPINFNDAYENLVTAGLAFGSLFRNLSNVKGTPEGSGEITGIVTVPDIAEVMPKNYVHPHLIHPATMDSIMHLFIASVMDRTGKLTLDRAMIPTFIKDVWMSAEITNQPSHTFRGYGKSSLLAYDKYVSDVAVWDGLTNEPMLSIKGIRATPLDFANVEQARKLCHSIQWQPDSDLLTTSSFSDVVLVTEAENVNYKQWINRFQLATLLQVTDALQELQNFGPDDFQGHYRNYFNWMKQLETWLKADQITGIKLGEWEDYGSNSGLKADLYRSVDGHNADGRLAIRMGSNIVKVLKGEVDPLHLMFAQDDLLDQVYEQVVKLGNLPAFQQAYLELVSHNSTNLDILEVGAGTGSSTKGILESLAPVFSSTQSKALSKIRNYTFTDISSGFFDKAKEKFKDHRDIMDFKMLNIEKDIVAQGFELASYDFVVAGNVIHATANLRKTLGNVQQLLKPGGKLILLEGIRQDFLWSGLSFGQLPGWWLGVEPTRQWSPWITATEWDSVLKDAGFSGIDLNLGDRQDPALHSQSLIIATALGSGTGRRVWWDKTIIITTTPPAEADEQKELANNMKNHMESKLKIPDCSIVHYMDLATTDTSRAVCISLMELEYSVLESPREDEYILIRQLLSTCGAMIWVTGDTLRYPQFNMITGLIRTVRWERDVDEANLVTFSVCQPRPSTKGIVEAISKLYEQQFIEYFPPDKINGEYMLNDGVILTARLVDSDVGNTYLASKFLRPTPVMQALGNADRPIKLTTASPGLLDKLEFVTDPVHDEPLTETQVEIEIKAVGLNFRDLMIAMGEHMAYSLGSEAAGVISRIGTGVNSLKVGDRVVYMCGLESTGCFHTFGRVDQNVVAPIPDSLSYEIAASLPVVYSTVIYGLGDAARLSKGEKVLIHAAAGGVGQAAINFSKHVGAEVFATVSTPEKRKLLMTEFGVPEEHIFSSRDLTFVKGIMRVTNNRGVDVVLNSLSGEALRSSWDLLAPFGRFVEIGKKDAQANGRVELHPFLRNVTMTSVELPTMMRHRPELIGRLTNDTIRLYTEHKIKEAVPTTILNYSQIENGFRMLQSGKGMGKMVFKPNPEDLVPIVPQQLTPYRLDQQASYVLAGGLGGIGRSLARWMVTKGARNLIFLSRSGKVTDAVKEMKTELESKGCGTHIFTCDITDRTRLAAVIEECKASLPPIKGCIQGSMILKDGMFENMSHETFQTAVKPKVQGSWNLHELLPLDLEFFILLSSATGVLGNRSQANYAAGNTYQDALAKHRVSKGLPAATIDLGTVLSVGYVAENLDKTMITKHLGTILEVLREDEIHTLIEYLMDPRSNLTQDTCQLVTGLTDLNMYRQRGVPPPTYLNYPLFTHLRTASSSRTHTGGEDPSFIVQSLLSAATSVDEASTIIANAIRAKLSSLLAIPLDDIDPGKSVSSNGVDSLVAMEFRTFLVKELGADIPLLDIMGTMSVIVLGRKIAGLSKLVSVSE